MSASRPKLVKLDILNKLHELLNLLTITPILSSETIETVNSKNNSWESITNQQTICKNASNENNIIALLSNLYQPLASRRELNDCDADSKNSNIIRKKEITAIT